MYCPSCGIENAYGLRYCKRCGENLTQAQQPGASLSGTDFKKLSGLFWAISVFGIVSLTMLFGSLIPLTLVGADRKIIVLILIFGSSTIGGIASMLIHQLSRLVTMLENSQRPPEQVRQPVEQNYPQIASPPQSVSSITEHTTRNFDHSAYDGPRARE